MDSYYDAFINNQRAMHAMIDLPLAIYNSDTTEQVKAAPKYIARFRRLETNTDRYQLTVGRFKAWLGEHCAPVVPKAEPSKSKRRNKRVLEEYIPDLKLCHHRLGVSLFYNPPGDGTCLYGAVAACLYGVSSARHLKANIYSLKTQLARYLSDLVTRDLNQRDTVMAKFAAVHGLMLNDNTDFVQWLWSSAEGGYLADSTWGDEVELSFFAQMLNVNILLINTQMILPILFAGESQVRDGHFGDIFTMILYVASANCKRTIVVGRRSDHYVALHVPKQRQLQAALWFKLAFGHIASSIADFASAQSDAEAASSSDDKSFADDRLVVLFDQIGPLILQFLATWRLVHGD